MALACPIRVFRYWDTGYREIFIADTGTAVTGKSVGVGAGRAGGGVFSASSAS